MQITVIASRIKELREILEETTKDVAAKAGISESEYLKYENAEADMPISVLYGVAAALNVDPTVILTGDAPKMASYSVVRDGMGVNVVRYKGYSYSSLATNYIDRDMDPMVVSLLKKSEHKAALVSHDGQEFNYVLEGSVKVVIAHSEFILNEGDSIYFDAKCPHGQYAETKKAKFLTVINEAAIKKGKGQR